MHDVLMGFLLERGILFYLETYGMNLICLVIEGMGFLSSLLVYVITFRIKLHSVK